MSAYENRVVSEKKNAANEAIKVLDVDDDLGLMNVAFAGRV
jgi:hypothetical protein